MGLGMKFKKSGYPILRVIVCVYVCVLSVTGKLQIESRMQNLKSFMK